MAPCGNTEVRLHPGALRIQQNVIQDMLISMRSPLVLPLRQNPSQKVFLDVFCSYSSACRQPEENPSGDGLLLSRDHLKQQSEAEALCRHGLTHGCFGTLRRGV